MFSGVSPIGAAFGNSIKNFKKSMKEAEESDETPKLEEAAASSEENPKPVEAALRALTSPKDPTRKKQIEYLPPFAFYHCAALNFSGIPSNL